MVLKIHLSSRSTLLPPDPSLRTPLCVSDPSLRVRPLSACPIPLCMCVIPQKIQSIGLVAVVFGVVQEWPWKSIPLMTLTQCKQVCDYRDLGMALRPPHFPLLQEMGAGAASVLGQPLAWEV
jgi:hypothetical protein